MQREVLKWVQGLDLTYALKNPQRDIANGFIVAEILFRYFPSEVAIHAFDRGIGMAAREANWALLSKLLSKLKVPVPRELIELVMRCQSGASDLLLTSLYSHLTHKKVGYSNAPILRGFASTSGVPHFAKPTASYRMKDPEIDRIADTEERHYRAEQVLGAFEASEPHESDRLVPKKRLETPPARQVRELEEVAPVEIKTVQVKTLGTGQLRKQQREISSSQGLERVSSGAGARNVLEIVKQFALVAVQRSAPNSVNLLDGVQTFMKLSKDKILPIDVTLSILQEISRRIDTVAESASRSPADFWKFWETVILDGLEVVGARAAVLEIVTLLVSRILAQEPSTMENLVREICFSGNRSKKVIAKDGSLGAALFAGWRESDISVQLDFLRLLKECVTDDADRIGGFVKIIPSLLEKGKSVSDVRFFDLIMHYALSGLCHPAPSVHGTACKIISFLLKEGQISDSSRLSGPLERVGGFATRGPTRSEAIETLGNFILSVPELRGNAASLLKESFCDSSDGALISKSMLIPKHKELVTPALTVAFLRASVPLRQELLQSADSWDSVVAKVTLMAEIEKFPGFYRPAVELASALLPGLGADGTFGEGMLPCAIKAVFEGLNDSDFVFLGRARSVLAAVIAGNSSSNLEEMVRSELLVFLRNIVDDEKWSGDQEERREQLVAVLREDLKAFAVVIAGVADRLRAENVEAFADSVLENIL